MKKKKPKEVKLKVTSRKNYDIQIFNDPQNRQHKRVLQLIYQRIKKKVFNTKHKKKKRHLSKIHLRQT